MVLYNPLMGLVSMNLLDIDFQSIKTPIIDAFTYVYGEKYRDIIRKRINNIYFISYFDVEGIDSYIHYLRGCKGKELSLRFLDALIKREGRPSPRTGRERRPL